LAFREFNLTYNTLEKEAYDETVGYYYLQYSATEKRWFRSINGICESSRETDITPYYAARVCENIEHRESVDKYVYDVIYRKKIFPAPLHYPTYHFDSSARGYKSHENTQFVCSGCWGRSLL